MCIGSKAVFLVLLFLHPILCSECNDAIILESCTVSDTDLRLYYFAGAQRTNAPGDVLIRINSDPQSLLLIPGTLIMIVQMNGAMITEATDSAYGNSSRSDGRGLESIGDAGNYEFNLVSRYEDNTQTIHLNYPLRKTYSYIPSRQSYQVIVVPWCDQLTIEDYTIQPWDGSIGGIFAVFAYHVVLNGTVTGIGAGFRGGICRPVDPGTGSDHDTFADNDAVLGKPNSCAWKGESIYGVPEMLTYCCGKGAPANGGGGGNNIDVGGGGGASFGDGGHGGISTSGILFGLGGIGIRSIFPQENIFLGRNL
jgi:hypothetical protein